MGGLAFDGKGCFVGKWLQVVSKRAQLKSKIYLTYDSIVCLVLFRVPRNLLVSFVLEIVLASSFPKKSNAPFVHLSHLFAGLP